MDGIPGSTLTGPFPVGQYAAALKDRLRGFTRVQVFGEVFNVRPGRVRVWFELRDERGALPCSMWRTDFDALQTPLADGQRIVAAGGCEYYPGSRAATGVRAPATAGVAFVRDGASAAGLNDVHAARPPSGLA